MSCFSAGIPWSLGQHVSPTSKSHDATMLTTWQKTKAQQCATWLGRAGGGFCLKRHLFLCPFWAENSNDKWNKQSKNSSSKLKFSQELCKCIYYFSSTPRHILVKWHMEIRNPFHHILVGLWAWFNTSRYLVWNMKCIEMSSREN